ncbi:ATP-binding protein [Kitasatospora sp. NPDC057500]|uniref:ATP-binding protein n=1 Tax=Kitasatospora sp. NPDC057500 TaxID=3346151 RepID=UPI003694968C
MAPPCLKPSPPPPSSGPAGCPGTASRPASPARSSAPSSPLPSGELLLPSGELLVSELVTNAVQHARTPRDRLIFVLFRLVPDLTLRIEVHDADSEKPALRTASDSDEAGRGLLLVHELATQWGCYPRVGGVGKFVWCHVSPGPAAA